METVKCKVWIDGPDSAQVFHVQSPSCKIIRIPLPVPDGQPEYEVIMRTAQGLMGARAVWESARRCELRKLADERKKTWIYDLPEYQDHIRELRTKYPIGAGVVLMPLTRYQMELLLRLANAYIKP